MADSEKLFASLNTKKLCPECQAELVFKQGKAGAFLGCSRYPDCRYIQTFQGEHESSVDKIIEGSECPECQAPLAVKHGRFGIFIGCSQYPQCQYKEQKEPQKDDTTDVACPQCQQGLLSRKQNRFGKYFYACNQYPACRYAINYPPVNQICEKCAWPVLTERSAKSGPYLQCPQKKCQHKQQKL